MPTPVHKPLNKGLQKTRELLTELQKFNFGTARVHRHHDVSDETRHLSLTKEQAQQAQECLDLLEKGVPDSDGWAEDDVQKVLETAILDAVLGAATSPQQQVKDAIATLGQELSKPLELWEVHQPVEGLNPRGLPVKFGNVRFYWGDEKTCRAMKSSVKRVLQTSPDSPGTKRMIAKQLAEQVEEDFKGKSFCSVVVAARSQNSAFARALRELSLSIDVVNLFADVIMLTSNGGRLYLPGEANPTGGFSMMLQLESGAIKRRQSISQNSPRLGTSSYLAGPLSPFSMSKEAIAALKPYGWDRASQILAKETRTEMEDRILAAMRWAGRATVTEMRDKDKKGTFLVAEQAFLLYAIALESLLLKKESELSYRLSLRGAHLLASKPEYRREVQKDLVDLYGVRSQIVHSGSSSVKPDQLKRLRSHTKTAIFIVLTHRNFRAMQTEKEFLEWFDARLLR